MNIGPVTTLVSGQSRLGGTKVRLILNIALILHYEYPSIKRLRPFDRSLADFLSGFDNRNIS